MESLGRSRGKKTIVALPPLGFWHRDLPRDSNHHNSPLVLSNNVPVYHNQKSLNLKLTFSILAKGINMMSSTLMPFLEVLNKKDAKNITKQITILQGLDEFLRFMQVI